ncbi:MAG TPA: hypothetical protein VFX15_12390 [Actinomycetes bacterium]|nr:hypothetical protein [Actinomycetes bacterium]
MVKLRKSKVPDAVRSRLDLREGERILAWADDGHGRLVVASETALHLQRTPPDYTRFGWEQIEHASYDSGVMTIELGPELGSASLRVPVGTGRELPVAIRDRITASVVVDRFIPLVDDRGVRIIGRRSTGGDVTWRLDVDPSIADQESVASQAQRLLEEVKSEVTGA